MTTFPGEANASATTNQALQHPHMEASSSNAPAVMARDLVRVFGQKMAVNHLNLTVQRGEFYGFLGPNGAGKSTTIKMMVGLLRPTSGSVWVGGVDVWKDPIRAHSLMGVLPEVLNIYERLSGREFLVFAGHMYGVPAGDIRRRAEDILRELTQRGTTVFFSSHIMEVVERLCTRVGIINQGTLVAEGTLQELRERASGEDKDATLEDIFLNVIGARNENHNLSWLE